MDEMTSLGKRVYAYEISYKPSTSVWGDWVSGGATLHEEISLVFGHPLRFPHRYSGADIDTSKKLMHIWSTFARTGVPPSQVDGTDWPPVTSATERPVLQIRQEAAVLSRNQAAGLPSDSCAVFKLGFDLLNRR